MRRPDVAGGELPARRRRGVRRPCRKGRRAHPRQRQPRTVQQRRRLDRARTSPPAACSRSPSPTRSPPRWSPPASSSCRCGWWSPRAALLRSVVDRLQSRHRTPRRLSKTAHDPRWTLAACVLASSLSFVDGSVLNVALPAIRASYGAGAADVQWVVNAYLLPLSALAPARRRARRPLWPAPAAGHRHRPVRRRLAGLRARAQPARPARRARRRRASARPCSCPTASPCSTPLSRARSAAARSASGPPPAPPSAAVAPLIGGWLVDHVGWPAIFYINLPLAAGRDPARAQLRRRKPGHGAPRAPIMPAPCSPRSGSAARPTA